MNSSHLQLQIDQSEEKSREVPLPYSPISGFLNLPPDEEIPVGIHSSYSDDYMSRGDDHDLFYYESSTHELEEEESTNLDTLGLQIGPFQQSREIKLNKHTSSQTLKAKTASIDKSNSNESLDWSETLAYQGQNSNTWSTSSNAVRAISNALRIENSPQTSSPITVISASLPSESHLLQQRSVKESWDEDFLFQEDENENVAIDTFAQGSNEAGKVQLGGKGKWDESSEDEEEEEDDDDDWNAQSVGEGRLPTLNSGSTIQSIEKEQRVERHDHLERSRPIYRDLPPISTLPSLNKFGPQKPILTRPPQISTKISNVGQDSFKTEESGQRDSQKASISSYHHHRTTSTKASPSSFRKYGTFELEEPPSRRHSHIFSKDHHLEDIGGGSDSPSRRTSRPFEGHWSQFLSSRLGHSRSPERVFKARQVDYPENEVGNRSNFASPTTAPLFIRESSPTFPPIPVPTSDDGKTNRRKAMHRKGGTSLSMSFGITAPWGNMNRSSSRFNDLPAESSDKKPATSVSLTNRKANASRANDDLSKLDGAFSNVKSAVMDSRVAPPSTVKPHRDLHQGGKRKLGMADVRVPRTSDEKNLTDDSTRSNSILHAPHSPTSYREPQMMLTSRSHSGSTSTATSAMSSSDYATSTGSMTEESTLYGSMGDTSTLPAPLDFKSSKAHSRGSSSSKIIPVPLAIQQKTEMEMVKKAPSARRIRVSASKSMTANDQILSAEFPSRPSYEGHVRSTTDVQIRLPSDPSSSSSSAKKKRNPSSTASFARRNSLGDLRIPSRISKAQEGIRANMNRVKDFANGIEELKLLRSQYQIGINKISIVDSRRLELEEEFGSWWECAEVLIGLGEGKGGRDDETDVTSLDQVLTFSKEDSLGSKTFSSDQHFQRPTLVSSSQSQASVSRSSRDVRPASSRASSSRSIDPQREIDILAAMLAGTPVLDVSTLRLGMSLRERTQSVNEGKLASREKRNSTSSRLAEAQGRLPLAGVSTSSLTFVDTPKHLRSRSHRVSQSVHQAKLYKQAREEDVHTPAQSDTTLLLDLGAMSTESVDVQGVGRRRRLRSTGKAGLQGLKDLLRAFKMNSSAFPYQGGLNQSRASLARTKTSDSRISLHDHDTQKLQPEFPFNSKKNQSVKDQPVVESGTAKSHSRTRSIFSKSLSRSASRSPTLQRHPIPNLADDSSSTSSRRCSIQDASSLNTGNRSSSLQSITKGRRLVSSGADSSTKDTSLDSEWTQGDFDHLSLDNTSPNTIMDPYQVEMDPNLTRSSTGKKRFFLFSKGFPPSAAKRHSRDILQWASNSRDSLDKSPQRSSLLTPSNESGSSQNSSSSPGMPRTVSNSKHPLLLTEDRLNRRSISNASSYFSISPISDVQYNGQRSTVKSSKDSTSLTISTMESTSSGSTQVATTPNTEVFRDDNGGILQSRRISSAMKISPTAPPLPSPPAPPSATYRKLALKPEAIPSLLLYLETTKERCQESLVLLEKYTSF